ncbi:MAG: hypothetical protein Q4D16_24955 [Eubacteriales bacterium]|nr:hypothetical protein [Eubacteriales bacterium]
MKHQYDVMRPFFYGKTYESLVNLYRFHLFPIHHSTISFGKSQRSDEIAVFFHGEAAVDKLAVFGLPENKGDDIGVGNGRYRQRISLYIGNFIIPFGKFYI